MNKKEALKLMKEHEHKFGYCRMCGPMIYCGFCGNNCCNGGSPNNCKDECKEAYSIQALYLNPWYHKLRFSISNFKYDILKFFKKIIRRIKK